MRFLKIKKDKRTRASGAVMKHPLIVDASRRFAPSSERKETPLRRSQCQLISGPHDSGKSRWLRRLYDDWDAIWGAKIHEDPVWISGIEPLSEWLDAPHVEAWWCEQEDESSEKEGRRRRKWASLSQKSKAQALADYLTKTSALLFLDDAHKLTGRKLQIARTFVLATKTWLISSIAENRLPATLRPVVERAEPQRTKLESDASYDATRLMMWFIIATFAVTGVWEAAIVLGGLQMLGSGRRASRAD